MKSINNDQEWTMVLKPKNKFLSLNLKETWQYRDLIKLLVKRNYKTQYKQTILGPIWFIVNPLLTTLVFTIIFGAIAKLDTGGVPNFLFYMAGNTIWSYFSYCLINTSTTFTGNTAIFGKVYFPRITVPISTVIFGLISFFIQLIMFIGLEIFSILKGAALSPNLYLLFLPLLFIEIIMIGLGLGIIISAMTTKYRDLQVLVTFGVQLFMYVTPVVYSYTTLNNTLKTIISINPMTSIFEIFRYAFFGLGYISIWQIIYSFISSIAILLIGLIIFNKVEKNFMDVV